MFDLERRTQIIVLVLIGALLFGGGYKYAKINSAERVEITAQQEGQEEAAAKVYVHVAGAVEKPGVYVFDAGSRVNDAVSRAVPLPGANLESMNLAALLEDGKRIQVPGNETPEENPVTSASAAGNSLSTSSGMVNINTASASELDTLPGIGPAYAERIITYREEHGGFSNIEELQEVAGIGPKTYEKLKDMITTY